MPFDKEQETYFGNLQYYKYYIRPTAERLYGKSIDSLKSKHAEITIDLLKQMAIHGTNTTWQLAKLRFENTDSLRTKEKEYRRLFVGRKDRGKQSPGLLELGLVVKDGLNYSRGPASKYRLSIHGLLYIIGMIDFSNKELDKIAENYANVIPKVFGKWTYLKSKEPKTYYKIKGLARGLLLDNISLEQKFGPVNELMMYLQIKYHRKYENISEDELAEQVSYWYYITFLISEPNKSNFKLSKILENDQEIYSWFMRFYREAKVHFENRLNAILEFDA